MEKLRPQPPYEAILTGTGEFPDAMLKFDKCQFASEDDMKTSLARVRPKPRSVKVRKWNLREATFWHPDMWQAFGWQLEVVTNNSPIL